MMLCAAVLLSAAAVYGETRALGPSLVVDLPAGITVERSEVGEDYLLYSFWKDSDWILSVYIGNDPLYPKLIDAAEVDASTPGLPGVQRRAAGAREMLLRTQDVGWPRHAHVFYSDLSRKNARLADALIRTLRPPERGPLFSAR